MAVNQSAPSTILTTEEVEFEREEVRTSTPMRDRNTSLNSTDVNDEDADEDSDVSELSSSFSRPNTPKSRGPKKRSLIWKYFRCEGHAKNLQTFCLVKTEGKDCKYVNKGRNTTNMRLHLENHHKEEMKKLQDSEKRESETKSNQSSASGSGIVNFFRPNQSDCKSSSTKPRVRNPYSTKTATYKTFKQDLTRLAGCTSFPLSMVESSRFHALLFNVNSRIADSLLSRNTLKKWVVDYSKTVKQNVIASLKEVKNFFVTVDIWSQPGLDKFYLGVVAIFYNPKSSSTEVAALACRDFPHPHTGLRIRQLLEQIFAEYDLDIKKVIRYITDKGANVVSALQPYRVIQRVKKTSSLDQVENPELSHSEDDEYVEIELDIEIDDEESNDDDEFLSDNDSDDGQAEENLDPQAENEEDAFVLEQDHFRQAFSKRLTCVAHALNIIFHKILDVNKSCISKLRKNVLKLLKKINTSGVANQELKNLTGKKLLKIAITRWNSFFFVLQRALLLKSAIISVCRERVWGIDFDWAEVKKIVLFLKPLAMATTYLEGDRYPTAASVIPSILSVEEHFQTTKEKYRDATMRRICDVGHTEMKKRFGSFMDVKHDEFDQTHLICSLLHPSKTLEVTGELFEEGKRRMFDFLEEEISEGHCLIAVPDAQQIEEAPFRNTETGPQSQVNKDQHTPLFKRRRIVNTSSAVHVNSNIAELKREVNEYCCQ